MPGCDVRMLIKIDSKVIMDSISNKSVLDNEGNTTYEYP